MPRDDYKPHNNAQRAWRNSAKDKLRANSQVRAYHNKLAIRNAEREGQPLIDLLYDISSIIKAPTGYLILSIDQKDADTEKKLRNYFNDSPDQPISFNKVVDIFRDDLSHISIRIHKRKGSQYVTTPADCVNKACRELGLDCPKQVQKAAEYNGYIKRRETPPDGMLDKILAMEKPPKKPSSSVTSHEVTEGLPFGYTREDWL